MLSLGCRDYVLLTDLVIVTANGGGEGLHEERGVPVPFEKL